MEILWKSLETSLIQRGLRPSDARELLWQSLQNEDLTIVQKASMVEDQVVSGIVMEDLLQEYISELFTNRLVVTSPLSAQSSGPSPTLLAFRLILASATETITFISPYLDLAGVVLIKEQIESAVLRGVRIRLLTRETEKGQTSRTSGIQALFELAGQSLEVRDYHNQGRGRFHYSSVHAKLVSADQGLTYVGSAEIRGNALGKNFELGAILQKPDSIQAISAFDSVWEIAKPILLPLA